jgi:hypothetical protein
LSPSLSVVILPDPAVIPGKSEIIDMICITKWAVLGEGNFSDQGEKNERMTGDIRRKFSDQKGLISYG